MAELVFSINSNWNNDKQITIVSMYSAAILFVGFGFGHWKE